MANNKKRRYTRLILAAGAASLLLSNASSTQIHQQASALSEIESTLQQQSQMKLASVQQIMNKAFTKIVAKNKSSSTSGQKTTNKESLNLDLSEKELNDELYIQLQSFVNTNADVVEGILSFDCVVGQTGCIYTNQANLAKGKMEPSAKSKLISSMLPIQNKKPQIHSKVVQPKVNQNTLAQTSQNSKATSVNAQSKQIIKKKNEASPPNEQNLQQKAKINGKRINYLDRKQKQLMKGIQNPIDSIEQGLAKVVKNKVSDVDAQQHDYQRDLMQTSTRKFNTIFNSMNNFKAEEKHIDVHEATKKMGEGGHKIHEGDNRPSNVGVRKETHTMGNQGVEHVQQDAEINIDEGNQRPIDKTAVQTSVEKHHHHQKPKQSNNLQKAQELVIATKSKALKTDIKDSKIQSCPKCNECQVCQCAAQSVSPLEELATHSNELTFQSADDKPEDIRLQIMPQDLRDFVTKDVQVLNSERIIGYNTYNNILEQEQGLQKNTQIDSNSDFYNVTVNFVMKRRASGKLNQGPKELPIQVYENSLIEVEKHQAKIAQEKAEQLAEEDNEPKVIMPNDLKLVAKPKTTEKSVHEILQESRIQKEDDQTVQTDDAIENSELVGIQQTEDLKIEKVKKQLQSIPIELNNAQLAAEIQSLTPEEANQLAQEAQSLSRPPNRINLLLRVENSTLGNNTQSIVQVKTEQGIDMAEMNSLNNLTSESNKIEESFTDYIVPDHEKKIVDSIFEEQMSKSTSNNSTKPSNFDEHLDFLSRVQAKAEKVLADQEKGIEQPITTNKLTQMMFNRAKQEEMVASPSEQLKANSSSLSQTLSDQEVQEEQSDEMEQESEEEANDEEEESPDQSKEDGKQKLQENDQGEDADDEEEVEKDENQISQMSAVQKKSKEPSKKSKSKKKEAVEMSKKSKKQGKKAKKAKKSKKSGGSTPKTKKTKTSGEGAPLEATLKKAAKLKKKLEKLKKDAEKFKKRSGKAKKTKKQSRPLQQVFDEIQFNTEKKEKSQVKDHKIEMSNQHQLTKDLVFDEKFLTKKLFLDYDKPLQQSPAANKQKTASQKAKAKLDHKKLKDPFGIPNTTPGKKIDKTEEQKKLMKEQQMQRAHHEKITKEIRDIFKGKKTLNSQDKKDLEDPNFIHKLFAPDEDNKELKKDLKTAMDQKNQLNAHKLFQGKTKEQQKLRGLIKGKHHIAQTATSGEIFDDENGEESTNNSTFTQDEILSMEMTTLLKKIDIDLKVLAKIEKERNPDQPSYQIKLVRVEADQDDSSSNNQELEIEPVNVQPESLAQQTTTERELKSADEFVQSKQQNILEMKDIDEIKQQNQSLSQTHAQQRVIQDMNELQKKFEETSKAKEEVAAKQEEAESIQEKLKEQAEEEKVKRQKLNQKAQAMAQADLIAKHALRKATEQAAINKQQHVLKIEKQVLEEQRKLAEKQKILDNHKKQAQKAKELVEKAQKEENEVKGRLEKEEKLRNDLEKKEQEKAQMALKMQEEIQIRHQKKMQKLIQQQVELQNQKKEILLQQEQERKRLESELEKVNKVRAELLKASGSEHQEQKEQKSIADNLNLLDQQQIVIQDAIQKVKFAEKQGEQRGLAEAQKLIKKQETQSLEQSEADVKKLEQKFNNTSQKVMNIINHFRKVHSDLQTLKSQYSQQIEPLNQTNATMSASQNEEDQDLSSKLLMINQSNYSLKMHSKQRQMKEIVNTLSKIKHEVPDNAALQTKIEETRDMGLQDLVMIDNELNLPH